MSLVSFKYATYPGYVVIRLEDIIKIEDETDCTSLISFIDITNKDQQYSQVHVEGSAVNLQLRLNEKD